MELQQALENIKRLKDKQAEQESSCIREHKEEAIPVLLDYIKYVADNPDKFPENFEDFDDQSYAMYLLAEFRVNDAFESFIKILEFDKKTIDWFLCDLLPNDYAQIIASVANIDNVDRLKVIIENVKTSDVQRLCALRVLAVMYVQGVYPAGDFFSYLEYIVNKSQDFQQELFSDIVTICYDVFAEECFDKIRELYRQGLISNYLVESGLFNENHLFGISKESSLEELKGNLYYTFINDTLESTRHWSIFPDNDKTINVNNKPNSIKSNSYNKLQSLMAKNTSKPIPVIKIGRNDPCPCGSGKKYKKCCIDKL